MPSRNEETSGGLWAAANKPRAKLRKLKRKLGKNYGHLTRQIKLRASPASLIVANALIGEDRYVLSRTQRAKLLTQAGLDQVIWICTNALESTLPGSGAIPKNVITFSRPEWTLPRLVDHPTFEFIEEVVGEGRKCRETTLYQGLKAGRQPVRQCTINGTKQWIRITTETQLERYFERCLWLAESIREHGLLPLGLSKAFADTTSAGGADREIRVGIDSNGKFFHCRYGRHRLAIAKTLAISHVPVEIEIYLWRLLAQLRDQIGSNDAEAPIWCRPRRDRAS